SYSALDAEGVAILARAVGQGVETVQAFVDAQVLTLQAAGSPTTPPAALFALLRSGIQADMDIITLSPATRLEGAMAQAADCNLVPEGIATNAATYAAELRKDAEYRSLVDLGPFPFGSF